MNAPATLRARRPLRGRTSGERFERSVRADLLHRRWMRWHALLLGLVCLGVITGLSALLLAVGVRDLALRWALVMLGGYAVFLGLLRAWCAWLLSREPADGNVLDALDPGMLDGAVPDLPMRAGGGGDFGGGGASASFDGGDLADAAGDAVGGLVEAAGSADEGVVVAVPMAVVVGIALLVAAGLGLAVFGLFGVEVLLGVAVEIAAASAGSALAWRAEREGWLLHALGRTWRPMLALVGVAVALAVVIGHWLPGAHSLPQALRMLFA